MADSYRLQVLKALSAHLEAVSTSEFNLAGCVFRGRAFFGDDSPETMISILEAPRPDVPTYAGTNREASLEQWQLLLQGWTKDDIVNPTDPAYGLMDAVEQRLGRIIATSPNTGSPLYPDEYMLGNLIASFSFGPGVVRPPTEGPSGKAWFYLPVRVGLAYSVG